MRHYATEKVKREFLALESEYSELERELQPQSSRTNNRSFLRKLTDPYFKTWSFEKRLYEALGVKYVQKAVRGTVVRLVKKLREHLYVNNADNYFIGSRRTLDALKRFELGTKINELVHVPLTAIGCYGFVEQLEQGDYVKIAGWSVGLLLNSTLAMLQRYNRARVQKVIERKEARRNKK